MSDKTAFDHVSDWFKILLKGGGIPALLIGLGWITVFFGAIPIGSAWASNAGFWVASGTGLLMIALGYHGYRKAVENLVFATRTKIATRPAAPSTSSTRTRRTPWRR